MLGRNVWSAAATASGNFITADAVARKHIYVAHVSVDSLECNVAQLLG